MQNKIRRKRLNNRSVLGCWQLVASIWKCVASKYGNGRKFLQQEALAIVKYKNVNP